MLLLHTFIPTLAISLLFSLSSIHSQIKYEREYRIRPEQVPMPAQAFVKDMGFFKKVKWYKEESVSGTSVEAKVKSEKKRYSIEFNENGRIEDIEVSADWDELSALLREAICDYLHTNAEKYSIQKIQKQYSGAEQKLKQILTQPAFENEVAVNYELVVRVKTEGKFEEWELLFSQEGRCIRKAKIVKKNTDILEY